jgi:putative thioredoxin
VQLVRSRLSRLRPTRLPVIVEFYGQGVESTLAPIIESYAGRIALATVHAPVNPQLVQAFQVTQVPTVAAVVGERPLQLYVGELAEVEVRQVLDQVLQLAAQSGVTGALAPSDGEPPAPVEVPLPPHHQEAYDAIANGDYATAVAEFKLAITQNPRDSLAVAGLAQVSLMQRVDGAVASDVRDAAASAPRDLDAQLAVADLDVAGGHIDDAFDRLLELFVTLDADGKNRVRTRLLEYFEIAGADDPRVGPARRRLTALLY